MTNDQKEKREGPGGCRKVILFIGAVVLALIIPITFLIFNVGRVIFSPNIVKRAAADAIVESDIIVAGLEWFSEWRARQRVDTGLARPNEDEPDIVQMLEFMDFDDWYTIKEEVLEDEVIIAWMYAIVDGVYAWIDNDLRLPDVVLDMADFKDRVNSEHGDNALMVNYRALPTPCTDEQIDDFLYRLSLVPPGTEVLYNLCQFPDPWREDQINDYHDSLEDVVRDIPDQFAVVELMDQSGIAVLENTTPEQVKRILRLTRLAMYLSIIVPVLGAGLLFMLAAGSHRQGFWVGIPLLAGGAMALILALIYPWIINTVAVGIPLEQVPEAAISEGTFFLLRLAREVFGIMILMSVIAAGLGLAGILLVKPGKRDEDELELVEEGLAMRGAEGEILMAASAPTIPSRAAATVPSPAPAIHDQATLEYEVAPDITEKATLEYEVAPDVAAKATLEYDLDSPMVKTEPSQSKDEEKPIHDEETQEYDAASPPPDKKD